MIDILKKIDHLFTIIALALLHFIINIMKIAGEIVFSNCIIPPSQIFILRKNVYAMVNHKPFAPGHVLVCSRREVPKLQDLTEVETIDLFMTAHEVCRKLQQIYKI